MNMNNNPTVDQLRALFALADDEAGHHCLWIDIAGGVHIDVIPEHLTPNGFEDSQPLMAVRFETFGHGNGYVGPDAAGDEKFISDTLNDLARVWPHRQAGRVIYSDGSEY
jgi:hypothetical protein